MLAFGPAGTSANPVSEGAPADLKVEFSKTFNRAWGRYYSLRYLRGVSAESEFTVESYGVWTTGATKESTTDVRGAISNGVATSSVHDAVR